MSFLGTFFAPCSHRFAFRSTTKFFHRAAPCVKKHGEAVNPLSSSTTSHGPAAWTASGSRMLETPNLCMDYKETTGTTAVTVTTNSQSATGTSKKIVELYTLFVFLTKMNLASPYFSVFKLSAQLKQHWTYGKFGAMLLPEILAAPKPCIHGIFYNSPQMFTRTLWYK